MEVKEHKRSRYNFENALVGAFKLERECEREDHA